MKRFDNLASLVLLLVVSASLAFAQQGGGGGGGGGGSGIPGPTGTGQCFISTASGSGNWTWGSCSGSSNLAFSSLTTGTNTTATMTIGSGATLNTLSGATIDFSATLGSAFKLPVLAGLTTSHNGNIGYDSTSNNWHGYQNGNDSYLFSGPVSGTYNNADCAQFGVASGVITLVDTGSACGGSSAVFQVNGTGVSSSSTINYQNSAATDGLTLTFTNPSAGNIKLGFTGTLTNAGLANSAITIGGTSVSLGGSTSSFPSPGAIGGGTPSTGAFTTLSATGQITSTLSTGTAPFSIASTTVVPNLNVSQLLGGTWAVPGTIGSTTPNSGAFTALSASTSLTLSAITGSTQCLQVSTSGVVSGSGSACGGSSSGTVGNGNAYALANYGSGGGTTVTGTTGIATDASADLDVPGNVSIGSSPPSVTGGNGINFGQGSAPSWGGSVAGESIYGNSGGYADVGYFNGSAFTDYGRIAAWQQSNVYGAFLQNFSSSTMSLPSSAAYAPTSANLIGYDSTNNRIVFGNGTNTSFVPWFTATPTTGQFAQWSGALGALTSGLPTQQQVTPTAVKTVVTASTNASTSAGWFLNSGAGACTYVPANPSGAITITLPVSTSQPASGLCITVINYGTGVITVAPNGQNVNGGISNLTVAAASATAPTAIVVVSDGTNYDAGLWGASGSSAVSSVSNSDSTLTITPTTGSVVASLNLANANTWTALQTFNAGITVTGPSGDAAMISLAGNTTNQTIPANRFAIGGFNTASATAYGWQPSSTAPSGTQFMTAGTPSSGWSAVGYVSSTGSGNVVLATSPTLVTPVLGTPTSVTLTNATGLPLAGLVTIGANTTLANVTNSTASATAAAIPSGIQNYVAGTGYNQGTAHQIEVPWVAADTSGSGTAQSAITSPSFTPAANDCVIYTTTTTNSGTGLTTNINSLGAKSVAIAGSSGWTTTLTASIIPANKPLLACYDGTNWDVQQTGTAASGGSGTVNSGTSGHTSYYATSTNAVSSDANLDDGATTANTLTYSASGGITASGGPVTAATPSGKAGAFFFAGNSANQTIPTNDFAWGGFSSASAAAYGVQPPNAAPSGTQCMLFPTPSSGWSQASWGNCQTESVSSMSAGPALLGATTFPINTVIASTVVNGTGHFTNLQVVTSFGGTCTTPPQFNVFDGTSNTGSTVTANAATQTKGTGTSTAQSLTFTVGDIIGIYISTAGATCTSDLFVVTAQYEIP